MINAIRRAYLSFYGTQSQKDLIIARQRIKKGWIKGKFAATADGYGVETNSPYAVSFCMVGAISNVATTVEPPYGEGKRRFVAQRDALIQALPPRDDTGRRWPSIPDFNDHGNTTLADVLATFDRAIFYKAKD